MFIDRKTKQLLNSFIDAIALFIITYCALPIIIVLFVIWFINFLFKINIPMPNLKTKQIIAKNKQKEKIKIEEKIETEITAIIIDDTLDKTTRNYLSSLRYLDSLSGLSELHPDAAYVLNFVPSEIIEQRARNYFQDILVKMNPENPIHELRRIYLEAAKAGHIGYDLNGNGHYCRKRKGGE